VQRIVAGMRDQGAREVTVRRAVPADAAGVGRVHTDAWRWAYDGLFDPSVLARRNAGRSSAMWQRIIEEGSHVVLVAERDGAVVGFAGCGASRNEDTASVGELFAIYIDPGAYRTGVGSALMARVLEELAAAGFREAILWVLEGNDRGRRFYERWGWRPDGATQDEPNGDAPPLLDVRYRRPLP
jgi:L-amino acid N-acyltransferase YncA